MIKDETKNIRILEGLKNNIAVKETITNILKLFARLNIANSNPLDSVKYPAVIS
jgi:hypothetical protein